MFANPTRGEALRESSNFTSSQSIFHRICASGFALIGRLPASLYANRRATSADRGIVVDLTGCMLARAIGASTDGARVVGSRPRNGVTEAWLVAPPARGDMNNDGEFDNHDSDAYVPALCDESTGKIAHPG